MIVLVDNEHVDQYATRLGEMLMAARTRIKYELEDLSGQPCLIVRYDRASPDFFRDLGVRGVFISGNSASADQYSPTAQEGIREIIRLAEWPLFGFCGGHQLIGETYGAPLEPIGELSDRDESFGEAAEFAPGMKHEFGYFPVGLTGDHPLFDGLGSSDPVVRHAHAWELKAVPDGFTNYAATPMTPIQMIVHDDLPIVGTQFHPEYATEEHPAGQRLIANFMQWARII